MTEQQPPLYQIINWDSFENAKSRTYQKPQFVCVPNKHGGGGLSAVQAEEDGAAIYGIWMWITQMCSRQMIGDGKPGKNFRSERDGYLTVDGKKNSRRLRTRELANMFRRPLREIERCLQVMCSPEVGWMTIADGQHEFLPRTPEGYSTTPQVSVAHTSEGHSKDDQQVVTKHGHPTDTSRTPQGQVSLPMEDTEQNRTEQNILSQGGGNRQTPEGHSTTPQVSVTHPSEGHPTDTDDVDLIHHSEAKQLFGKLAVDVFGRVLRPTQWPNDLEHYLSEALPMRRGDWELLDWFYRLPDDHAIFKITMRCQKFDAMMQKLPGELDKIRVNRRKLGLNGLHPATNKDDSDGMWNAARMIAAQELYGEQAGIKFPPRFDQMPKSSQIEIDKEVAKK
jgi:hypothetical protein